MSYKNTAFNKFFNRTCMFAAMIFIISACATPSSQLETNDPFEKVNRGVHGFNKGLDKAVIGPAAKGYRFAIPKTIRNSISNFAGYLALAPQAVNNILQADPVGLRDTVATFGLNSLTFGLGDLASEAGINDNNADFGETLYKVGIGSGPYLEIPLLGPSNVRDFTGFLVDSAMNPANFVVDEDGELFALGFTILDRLNTRGEYARTIEDTLYASEDSYEATKSIFLQNRAFKLNRGINETTSEDPLDDF